MMGFVWRILRFVMVVAAIAGLIVSIKACNSPPEQTTAPQSSTAVNAEQSASNKPKININTAILSELDKLEAALGVPALSHKIQASRPYGSIDDLVSKKVVSQAQFDQIKNQLTVEEIVLTGVAKDVDYMTKLGLMKGHMLVANELLVLKQPEQADPHLGHPVEEIYVDLEEQFQERNVPEFKQMLIDVQTLVRTKPNDPQIQPKFDTAMKAIDTAIAALPEDQRSSPNFTMQVINGMLETATAEYTAAIANNKIREVIEYQDSRGFVAYAQDTLFQKIEPQVTQADAKVSETLNTAFTDLRKAWPQAIPPATPVLSPDEVATKVKNIEMTSQPLLTAAAS
ncbi:MAG: helix-hairpin-helix domain-containing protein [Leptolyngbyaceae cyanobacterium bins.302]|nr:helix-hairpin-helix domain-containing protein [Leptolyngbyaceae cyanobacterium bins.302]